MLLLLSRVACSITVQLVLYPQIELLLIVLVGYSKRNLLATVGSFMIVLAAQAARMLCFFWLVSKVANLKKLVDTVDRRCL